MEEKEEYGQALSENFPEVHCIDLDSPENTKSQKSNRSAIEDKLKLALKKRHHSRSSSSDDAIQAVSILSINKSIDKCSNLFSMADDSMSHRSGNEGEEKSAASKKVSTQSRDSLIEEGFNK